MRTLKLEMVVFQSAFREESGADVFHIDFSRVINPSSNESKLHMQSKIKYVDSNFH